MLAPHDPRPVEAASDRLEVDPLRNPERRRRAAAASAVDIACGAPSDSFVIPAVAELIAPHIAQARAEYGEPLPSIRSEAWLHAPDSVKLATLLTCGVAYLVADPHRVVRNALKQVALDIHGAVPRGYWATIAGRPPHEEIQRLRYPPDGDPHGWAQNGAPRDDVA